MTSPTFNNPNSPRRGIPTAGNTDRVPLLSPPVSEVDFLDEEDEELAALEEAMNGKGKSNFIDYGNDRSIEEEILNNLRKLREQYTGGGIKTSRVITTSILRRVSPSYFGKYDNVTKETVDWVQTKITDNKKSTIISTASQDPTNDGKQDDAYHTVKGYIAEYLDEQEASGRYVAMAKNREADRAIISSLVCNEIIGFGKLDPLWRDKSVNEIICNGPYDIQVEIGGVLTRVPGCAFRDRDHLSALIERLYSAIGKLVSRSNPIVDGRLHDNSRMAVMHESCCPDGPNFNIRRHKEDFVYPSQLVAWDSASEEMMVMLGNLIYKGCSVLVVGGTSSGKTTLLSALTGFFRNDHRILTLEDNIEMKVADGKLKAAAMECLDGRSDQPGSGIAMRDLVKASLRLSPQAIIVGEVRDESCYDLCQALNTGHYGMSTVHANSDFDAIYRLVSLIAQGGVSQGSAVFPLIAASFDVIVRIDRFPVDGSRRIVSISEVGMRPIKNASGELELPVLQLFKFVDEGVDPKTHKLRGHWDRTRQLSKERTDFRRLDLESDLSWEELKELCKGTPTIK